MSIDQIDTAMTPTATNTLPRHVAVIMDGNGRWALAQGLDRSAGHVEGVATVHRITQAASDMGIKFLTLYTFSTENWNRPPEEVGMLMHLIVTAIEQETPELIRNNVRLRLIGDRGRIPAFAMERLDKCMADTEACTGLTVILAISYSSRWEIARAARRIAVDAAAGTLDAPSVNEETIGAYLATAQYPDPDIVIRTGGDMRLSNFLLWQAAYAEIFVTDTYWPAFTTAEFKEIIHKYMLRERRFGLTGEQARRTSTAHDNITDADALDAQVANI